MAKHVVFLSIPHLRPQDVEKMASLTKLREQGAAAALIPQFPALTWPVQATMMTGVAPSEHGITANGLYRRDTDEVDMWTFWNKEIQAPQVWDKLREVSPQTTTGSWFPLLTKGANVHYAMTPKPKHNPDGTETMWCYSRPEDLYEQLLPEHGHFPLHHFWGPLSSIKGSEWIVNSALSLFEREAPNFLYIYIPHLDYAAQKTGPDSPEAMERVRELDELLEKFFARLHELADDLEIIVAGEYVITPVSNPVYPNRLLREAGFLALGEEENGRELLLTGKSKAWALCDHQIAHVYVKDADVEQVAAVFRGVRGIEHVLVGDAKKEWGIDHPNSGEIVLVSDADSWFAYPWWLDDAKAPSFAATVDIHRKPGYDPVELFLDPATRKIPLDASLVKGSHGRVTDDPSLHTVLISSRPRQLPEQLHQREIPGIIFDALDISI